MFLAKFGDVKNYNDMKRFRTLSTKTTDGKLFCAFISLIIASEIGVKLEDLMRRESWIKGAVRREDGKDSYRRNWQWENQSDVKDAAHNLGGFRLE
jgi:hypothetical protein